jgi:hypothetical protein
MHRVKKTTADRNEVSIQLENNYAGAYNAGIEALP